MNITTTIRRAKTSDADALALVGSATFLETYAHMIPGPDMIRHCSVKHAPEVYAAWLADPRCVIWLAESQVGAPVGYLVLTPATLPLEGPGPDDLEVMRIYVLSRVHRTGLGHELMNRAIEEGERRGAPRLVLGVHNDNSNAIAFYHRQGFELAATRTFQVGASIFHDSVLARPLAENRRLSA